jgi:hypothetical protein
MSEHINSASRILNIIQLAKKIGENRSILDVWAEVFRVDGERATTRALMVTNHLNKLHDEITLLHQQLLKQDKISSNRYENEIPKLEDAVSTYNLSQTWAVAAQYLTERTITSLEFLSELLPTEEKLIPEENLNALLKLLDELEMLLRTSDLDAGLVATIQRQVETIKVAINNYGVNTSYFYNLQFRNLVHAS